MKIWTDQKCGQANLLFTSSNLKSCMYGRGCMLYSHHNVLSVLRVILLLQESSSFSFLVCVVYILFHNGMACFWKGSGGCTMWSQTKQTSQYYSGSTMYWSCFKPCCFLVKCSHTLYAMPSHSFSQCGLTSVSGRNMARMLERNCCLKDL